MCLNIAQRCDGNIDCSGGEDESGCGKPNFPTFICGFFCNLESICLILISKLLHSLNVLKEILNLILIFYFHLKF